MSRREFWDGVRAALGPLPPTPIVDAPRLDAGVVEGLLQGTTDWLDARAVAGFDAAALDFLPDDERNKLSRLVADFRRIAPRAGPIPLEDERVGRALPLFRDIVLMLEFDRYGSAEAYRLGKRIERAIEADRPEAISELRFDTGADSTGDPALWIWVILKDEAAAKAVFSRITRSTRELLFDAAREATPERWPYIGFRTVSEQAELAEDARA